MDSTAWLFRSASMAPPSSRNRYHAVFNFWPFPSWKFDTNPFYLDVEYGAELTLKNDIISGGYLHSHRHIYPKELGPAQQQITSYIDLRDPNNIFIPLRTRQVRNDRLFGDNLVRNGDVIRLEHNETEVNLHSHNFPAPITRNQYQVSGYGDVSQSVLRSKVREKSKCCIQRS